MQPENQPIQPPTIQSEEVQNSSSDNSPKPIQSSPEKPKKNRKKIFIILIIVLSPILLLALLLLISFIISPNNNQLDDQSSQKNDDEWKNALENFQNEIENIKPSETLFCYTENAGNLANEIQSVCDTISEISDYIKSQYPEVADSLYFTYEKDGAAYSPNYLSVSTNKAPLHYSYGIVLATPKEENIYRDYFAKHGFTVKGAGDPENYERVTYYENEKTGVICDPFNKCTHKNWYIKENSDDVKLINDLAQTFIKNNDRGFDAKNMKNTLFNVSDTLAVQTGQQRAEAIMPSLELGVFFYSPSYNSPWKLAYIGGQSAPSCDIFDNEDIMRAFDGTYCDNNGEPAIIKCYVQDGCKLKYDF